ncbi:MAG: hypothetical protein AVO33_08135 [delta proteobacterium ML8_F1]|nr:MAG: hypothetical protein AVO33_08135 [delta proteobacterium ML8_F1]
MRLKKHGLLMRGGMTLGLLVLLMVGVFLAGCTQETEEVVADRTYTMLTPPDPNSIPLLLLELYQEEMLEEGVRIEVKVAPAGDPAAMSAMISAKEADFALFNALGGARQFQNGAEDLRMLGVHIWKGVYLLAREGSDSWADFDGVQGLAVPGVGTTPHIMAQKALVKYGAEPQFAGMGPGLALWTALGSEDNEIEIIAAAEPAVTMLLMRQQSEDWPVKYRVYSDLARELSPDTGEVPLGALFLIDRGLAQDEVGAGDIEVIVKGFEEAIGFMNDPANIDRIKADLPGQWQRIFSQELPPQMFVNLIQSGRIGAEFRQAGEIKESAMKFWLEEFNFELSDQTFFFEAGKQ